MNQEKYFNGKFSIRRSLFIPMMFSCLFLGIEVATTLAEITSGTKVGLPFAVHFLTPGGEDAVVGPGLYHIEVAESWLKFVLEGEGLMSAILLEGNFGTHEETLPESVVKAGFDAADPDVFHVALLRPDGTGLEAIGTKSGIRLRGLNFKFLKKMNTSPPRQLFPLPAIPERFSSLKFSKPGHATKLASDLHDRCVLDVESQITQTLHDGGDYRDLLAYRPGGTGELMVKHTGRDEKDAQEWKHHRGVARYFSGQENYLYVSDSVNATVNQGKHVAGVEVIALNQRKDSGPLGSNIRNNRYEPPSSRYTVKTYVEEADSQQSGGIQVMGRFLVVPYAGKPDYLRLYDLQDPPNPVSAATLPSERNIHFTFAALTRLNNGRYLAIGGSDLLEVFVTKATSSLDDWESHSAYNPGKTFVHPSTGPVPDVKYQGAQFVTDCSGILYLVLSRKNKNWRNEYTENWLDVWKTFVHESKGTYSIELIKKFSRQINCEGGGDTQWCDFAAGAGLYIDRENGDVLMYGIEPGSEGPKADGAASTRMKEFPQN